MEDTKSRYPPLIFSSFLQGAVNAYFLTDSVSKKTVVFEAAIFVGQSEDGAEVRVYSRVSPDPPGTNPLNLHQIEPGFLL